MVATVKATPARTDDAPTARSLVPAIDAAIDRLRGRAPVAATEVVDLLLDLRLIAWADDVVNGHD
jgi:hypothetical protein